MYVVIAFPTRVLVIFTSVGRKDDVITLSTGKHQLLSARISQSQVAYKGEKIVPVAQEGRVSASPLVTGCVMFGREQEQAGLLVEVASSHTFSPSDEAALIDFRRKLWYIPRWVSSSFLSLTMFN